MCKPIAAFTKLHPKLHFDLDLNDRRIDLLEEGMDLALRIGHLKDSSLIARRLFEARTVIAASPHYIKTHGAPRTPEELADHDCLVYSNLADPDRWGWKNEKGKERVVKVNTVLRASSGDFLANAAAHGMGIVIQPTFLAAEAIRRGNLVPILTDYQWPVTPAYAVYPPTRHLSYRVRAFIDFLAEKFAGVPQWDRECETLSARQS
jgi:DNA-binding transcriptional LysR family regulator